MRTSKKIIFAGTPEFASIALSALVEAGFDVVAVYTQPDRPAGRGKKVQYSAVKQVAIQNNIPVEQPLNFRQTESLEQLQSYQADLMVVAAYGIILPQSVLDSFQFGCINIHGSLLPRWRGAAPIQRSIAAGDRKTGITIMQMDKGLDTGDMLLKVELDIEAADTGASLHDKLADLGAKACVQALNDLEHLVAKKQKQDDAQANYAHKLDKKEAKIDWSLPSEEIERNVRAFNSWPVCFSILNDKVIKIWQVQMAENDTKNARAGEIVDSDKRSITVACGKGALKLLEAQLPNSRKMAMRDILNSKAEMFAIGQCFES